MKLFVRQSNVIKHLLIQHNQVFSVPNLRTSILKLHKTMKRLNTINKHGNRLEQSACEPIMRFLSSALGSLLASLDIYEGRQLSPQTLSYFQYGLHSDVSSSKLKLASVLYCTGDMVRTARILEHVQKCYDLNSVMINYCNTHWLTVIQINDNSDTDK